MINKNAKLIVLALAALPMLVGCKPGEDKAIDLAQKEIAMDMKDPDSAKFRFVRVVQTKENEDGTVMALVCGQVNAKNGFGAYAGFHSFMIDLSMKPKGFFDKSVTYKVGHKKLSVEDDGSDIPVYRQLCGEDS